MAEHFAGMTSLSPEERFEYHIWHRGQSGQLEVDGALAHLHGNIVDSHSIGTHQVLYVALTEIRVHGQQLADAPSLVYFRRSFRALG